MAMDMQAIMRQAQKMQNDMNRVQEELRQTEVEGAAGGGEDAVAVEAVRYGPQGHLHGEGAEVVEQKGQGPVRRAGGETEEEKGTGKVHRQVGETV